MTKIKYLFILILFTVSCTSENSSKYSNVQSEVNGVTCDLNSVWFGETVQIFYFSYPVIYSGELNKIIMSRNGYLIKRQESLTMHVSNGKCSEEIFISREEIYSETNNDLNSCSSIGYDLMETTVQNDDSENFLCVQTFTKNFYTSHDVKKLEQKVTIFISWSNNLISLQSSFEDSGVCPFF